MGTHFSSEGKKGTWRDWNKKLTLDKWHKREKIYWQNINTLSSEKLDIIREGFAVLKKATKQTKNKKEHTLLKPHSLPRYSGFDYLNHCCSSQKLYNGATGVYC